MVGLISAYIEHFTYIGLFVVLMLCGLGLPIPEDVALLAGGYLVHRGITRYPITLAVSLLGVVVGDNSLYFLGRRFGSGIVRYISLGRPGAKHQIERIEAFVQRHGHRAIFYARFLAGLLALPLRPRDGAIVQENTLDVYVARLRRKLAALAEAPSIKTHPGVGYRLQ